MIAYLYGKKWAIICHKDRTYSVRQLTKGEDLKNIGYINMDTDELLDDKTFGVKSQ